MKRYIAVNIQPQMIYLIDREKEVSIAISDRDKANRVMLIMQGMTEVTREEYEQFEDELEAKDGTQ